MLSRYLPVFLILALLAEVLGTIGGFGSSVFFVPVANFYFDFQSVLGITALFHLSSNVTKIAFFRKGLDKRLLLYLGIPAIIFVSIGAFLSKYVNPGMLGLILGVFLIVLSLVFLIFKKLVVKDSNKNAIAGGVLSGLSAGLLGTGGAIRGITMAAFKMDKATFIATSAAIDFGVDASRAVIYYYNGYMHQEHLYIAGLLLIVAIVGTWIGKRILAYFSQEQFRTLVLVLILIIGIASVFSDYIKM
ncbi:sulfite exporter TauE/SafE family protein [Nonlabens ulvanivorans]|uniref:sulfite exporter TauE/SafE family protein n=1 Tax=Nonlabens ulvanivorans TaxID=906888 RepID=UPI0029439D28|nr:sulfite exporter TauE/SafE family protein [Nonlabens ulvanivorans]WOI21522.1 sulfite exporter TauE/SafE family protein [Nonlabens ulvanivorans]